MSIPFAVVALLAIVGLAGWFWEFSRCPKPIQWEGSSSLLQAAFAVGAAFGLYRLTSLPLVAAAPLVVLVGGILSGLTSDCSDRVRPSLIALGALPAVLAVLAGPADKDWMWIGSALAVVASLGFWATWTKNHRQDAAILPLTTVATSLLLLFLKLQSADYGLSLAGAIALVATLGLVAAAQIGSKSAWAPPVIGLLVAVVSAIVIHFGFHQPQLALVAGAAGVTALVVGWLWGDGDPNPTAGALAVLAWTGVATVGFSQAQTPGLAAAAIVGLGVTSAMGRPAAAAALSPLLALAAYRLLRNLAPETLDAMDIGQHYAVVGLLVGSAVTVALNEFVKGVQVSGKARSTLGFVAGWIAAGGLAAFAALFLGDKGAVGVVFGLALGGALSCLSGRGALSGAVFGAALSWLIAAFTPVLGEWVSFNKDNKMGVFAVAVVIALALAATAAALTRPQPEEPRAEA